MKLLLFWDTSALAKGYIPEQGSETAEELLESEAEKYITFPIYAETIALMLRRKNQGELLPAAFQLAVHTFDHDTFEAQHFQVLETDAETILASIPIILSHNLNSSDAAILATYLRYASSEPQAKPVLISADLRLKRAANAEGLSTLNPEEISPDDLNAILAFQ